MTKKTNNNEAAAPTPQDDRRYIIVYPQVDYNQPPQNGRYQAIDPVLTREELEAKVPLIMQNPGGNGAGFRVYEITRYVPVEMKVSLDGDPFELPDKKAKAKELGDARKGIVPSAVGADPIAVGYADVDDFYEDEGDY